MKKIVLFDLDGTLSDPKVGITKSVQYALQKLGIDETNLDKLECFIGPPLQDSFAEYYQLNVEETKRAIDFYRERFTQIGMFENELYLGIPQLLSSLKNQTLVVATSKPTVFSKQILSYFKINHFFDLVVGSNLDGTRTSKTEIIEHIIEKYKEYSLKDFIMIGDRKHDIIGAKNNGMDSIGVSYGYGSIEELKNANPTYIADSVEQLAEYILKRII